MSRREIAWYENDMFKDVYNFKRFTLNENNQNKDLDN